MDAGPALDSLIARTLWKFIVIVDTQSGEHYLVRPDHSKVPLPKYSTSVADAYLIAGHFQAHGHVLKVRSTISGGKATFYAAFCRLDGREYRFSEAATLPLAICYAALAATQGQNAVAK